MPIDIRQFHQTFFEESLEGLADMETELLSLEQAIGEGSGAQVEAETLNTLFRAVHSIKGASGTFGYGEIAEFAHALETLMDALRAGELPIDARVIALLLRAVDQLRAMIQAASAGRTAARAGEQSTAHRLRDEVETLLAAAGVAATGRDAPAPADRDAGGGPGWEIGFRPGPGLLANGNDPLRIFRELAGLGRLTARTDISALPDWEGFDPAVCHLSWQLRLETAASRAQVTDAFEWVLGDCDLTLAPLARSRPPAAAERRAPDSSSADTTPAETGAAAVGSIRVGIAKVDALINMVGELVITQAMLTQTANDFAPDKLARLQAGVAQLERNTRDLQESVMSIRMLPIGFVFNRLPRAARDTAAQLGKRVRLTLAGERTELDKTVIERISDPLLHLVRNSIDHGIEPPAQRVAAGKSETGTIALHAQQKGGNVIIELSDDGAGLPRDRILARARRLGRLAPDATPTPAEIDAMIFLPGLSTAEVVSDISGRGVGMDVVRNNIQSLGGSVEVESEPGRGTRFTLRLPLTLAILEGLSVQVGEQSYIIPLVNIAESICLTDAQVSRAAGGPEMFALRDEFLPLVRLHEVFNVAARAPSLADGILVVIEADGRRAGVFVDELLGQQQVVIKNLAAHYQRVDGIAAATILGDGAVALILDAASLVQAAHARSYAAHGYRGGAERGDAGELNNRTDAGTTGGHLQ
ncbi:MAG TPA: chemotaxis protein CheA [Acidiferrobacterales bacterium]